MEMEELGGGGKCLVDQYGGGRMKPNPPPFLMKTYLLVDDPSTDGVISWNPDGTSFVVWHPADFSRDLLPTFFKHSNFSSFIRQLNTYGFRKVTTSRWEFCNDMFLKGKRELLCQIRRRKNRVSRPQPRPATSSSSTKEAASPWGEADDQDMRSCSTSSSLERKSSLSDENKRLKRENGVLSTELCGMKKRFKELLDLVSMYKRSAPSAAAVDKCCDHNDADEDDPRPKLFGVRLGGKELKEVDDERKRELEISPHSNSELGGFS